MFRIAHFVMQHLLVVGRNGDRLRIVAWLAFGGLEILGGVCRIAPLAYCALKAACIGWKVMATPSASGRPKVSEGCLLLFGA